MSRHSGFPSGTGYPRLSADVNGFFTEMQTKSAAVDEENLIREGLDIRNFGAAQIMEMELQGNRLHYDEWATETQLLGVAATYRNEGIVPLALGGNPVELDWTASPLTPGANDELVVEGVISFGRPAWSGARAGGGAGSFIIAVSAVVLLDFGAGYVVQPESRQGRRGRTSLNTVAWAGVAQSTMHMQAFDLCPTFAFPGTGASSISRVGLALGFDLPSAAFSELNIMGAQLHTYLSKRCR